MSDFDLYFYCDIARKEILEEAKPLDENWNTIGGLRFLSDEELKDLSWAGYDGVGFLKLHDPSITQYAYSDRLLGSIKSNLKQQVENRKNQRELFGIIVNNSFNISLSLESKTNLIFKYLYCKEQSEGDIQLDTNSGIITLSVEKFIKIFNFIQVYLDKMQEVKINTNKNIDDMLTIFQLSNFDLNCIEWPQNAIEIF